MLRSMLRKIFTLSGFKLSLLITVLILAVFAYNTGPRQISFLNLLDKKWVDFILKGRGEQPHTDEVVIATIDTKSVDRYGRWPWPRSRMAELVEVLNDHYNVATIGFDIVFSEPEQGTGIAITERYQKQFASLGFPPGDRTKQYLGFLDQSKSELDGDARFGSAMAKKPTSILGYFFFADQDRVAHATKEELAASARRIAGSEISLLKGGAFSNGVIPTGYVPESNIDKIFQGGVLSGFFDVNPDREDGTVRRVHLLMQHGENIYPALVLQVLRHYYGAKNISVEIDAQGLIEAIEVGKISIETNFDGSILLNYKGPAKTFPHYAIYDLIERKIPKEALEDKIVLVGATEKAIYDLRNTPVGVDFPGVEIHANLLDNLLTNSYFKLDHLNDVWTFFVLLGFGLLLGVTLPNLKNIYGTVLVVVLLVGYALAHRWMVMELLTWTSFIYPALAIVLIWGGVTLYRFVVTDKDKRFIKGAFQQYLSPEVINQLMDNPQMLQLGGERRVMTAFFSDVQGFSTISEQLDPTELVKLLNVFLTAMTNLVTEVDGTIDKYEGDAIIAFFGAPMPHEDHAKRACMVSLAMQKRLVEMREQWEQEGTPLLYMRIGLNTGAMVVGNMGSEKRFDYTMMGNAVNLAARLEGANKNYATYTCISEMTYEAAKDAIEVRELDLIRVIGITTAVRIYELVAKKGELSEEQRKGFAYFAKGLELYRQQQWEESAKYFNAVNKFIPDDPPAAKFVERCRQFKANPPGSEWDGVFEATEK